MARKSKVFNRLGRPRLLRKVIPTGEAAVGVLLLLVIVGMILWLGAQRSNYDPGERDIETALLIKQSVEDNLYRTPLKRWRDPSLGDLGPAPVNLGPFDPSLLTGGWRSVSTPQTFEPDTLYEKTVIELEHPGEGRSLDVFLYDQGTFEGSLGVYQEQRGDKPVAHLEGVHYTPNTLGAIGMSGRLFFHALGDAPADSIEAMTQGVVKALARLGQQGIPPPGFETLNRGLGVPFEQIGYQPSNVFQYRFARRFWFADLEDAAGARIFFHTAESPTAARELFDKLRVELLEDYDSLVSTAARILLQHRFLETYFGLMHEGTIVFGVEKHPQREAVAVVLKRLQTILHGQGDKIGEDLGGKEG